MNELRYALSFASQKAKLAYDEAFKMSKKGKFPQVFVKRTDRPATSKDRYKEVDAAVFESWLASWLASPAPRQIPSLQDRFNHHDLCDQRVRRELGVQEEIISIVSELFARYKNDPDYFDGYVDPTNKYEDGCDYLFQIARTVLDGGTRYVRRLSEGQIRALGKLCEIADQA